MKKKLMVYILFIVAQSWILSCDSKGSKNPFAITTVKKAPLIFKGAYYGSFEAEKSIPIYAPEVMNTPYLTIEWILEDGRAVNNGDIVMKFEKSSLIEQLEKEKDELAIEEAQLVRVKNQLDSEFSKLELDLDKCKMEIRIKELTVTSKGRLISKLDRQQAMLDVKKAKLEFDYAKKRIAEFEKKYNASIRVHQLKIDELKKDIANMQKELNDLDVKTTASGIIYAPYARLNYVYSKAAKGKVVRPGDKILEIPDLNTLVAKIYVRQSDASHIKVNDPALVYPTIYPNRPIEGKIVKKDSFATSRNERLGIKTKGGNLKEIAVFIKLKTLPDGLKPGNTLRARVTSTLKKNALVIPLTSVKRNAKNYEIVLADGTTRVIKLGESTNINAEVLEGLKENQRIRSF